MLGVETRWRNGKQGVWSAKCVQYPPMNCPYSYNEVTHLINVNRERSTVRKTVTIAACCAHIEVPRLTASWQKTNLSHKTHDPAKNWTNLAGFYAVVLLAAFPPSSIIAHTQSSMIIYYARPSIVFRFDENNSQFFWKRNGDL